MADDDIPETEAAPPPRAKQQVQAQKLEALGGFAGGIAHDFNNILSIIEGYAHVALHQGGADVVTLQKILSATQRGAGLTRQLLAFSRQKIGMEQVIDLSAAVQEQEVLLRPLLGANIRLHMTPAPAPLYVTASTDFITQILLNLALNARDAMPDGGTLAITCKTFRGQARLTVADSGSGIAATVLPRIFDPFFTTKPQGAGTGLGLSVVHGIVTQLGGRIAVDGNNGAGARFDIDLPLATAPLVTTTGGVAPHPTGLEGRTVLIAEDEPELLSILGIIFSDFDMKVLTASNGNDALEMQRHFKGTIDFLLTDVIMPGMDGPTLGQLFAAERPASNIIYMSGYPFMDLRLQTPLPPDADFIPKPLRESKILDILRRALERRDARLRSENTPPPDDGAD
ncbi:MAG: ATP-binding protein [Micavibrio sp.]|nr:ATP-binding protein [Micavibrio sp.]